MSGEELAVKSIGHMIRGVMMWGDHGKNYGVYDKGFDKMGE